ncbi:unnamed protein product [marine sediment metagenome]|uniref:Methyltransferase type 11 domain-containing protein n=1 Tax=marine sediment metagenome TaxID=412755 RepID=X0RFR2_9ZZZZ
MDKQQEYMKDYWKHMTMTLTKAMYIVDTSNRDWNLDEFLIKGKNTWDMIYNNIKNDIVDYDNILEIGCGLGRILLSTVDKFKESYGVDIDEGMINFAKKIRDDKNLGMPIYDVVDGTGSLSLYKDNFFSNIFSFICFQHIPYLDVQQKYIMEIERILKPGGIATLLIQNLNWRGSNNDINFGRGMSIAELENVTGKLKVIRRDDGPAFSPDDRNYWVILKKEI